MIFPKLRLHNLGKTAAERINIISVEDKSFLEKYSVIDKTSLKRSSGGIVCMCEEVMPIDSDNCFIPSNII